MWTYVLKRLLLMIPTVLGAAAGFYYYFKIIRSMYWESPEPGTADQPLSFGPLARVAIILLTAAVFLFGIYPKPILALLG